MVITTMMMLPNTKKYGAMMCSNMITILMRYIMVALHHSHRPSATHEGGQEHDGKY